MPRIPPLGGAILHSRRSVRSRATHLLLPYTLKPILNHMPLGTPVFTLMRALDFLSDRQPDNRKLRKELLKGDHWTAHLYTPKGLPRKDQALVYFHGGAFFSCGLGTHKRLAEALALMLSMPVLLVGYRQYPAGHMEDALLDCEEAIASLIKKGYAAEKLIFGGDSAGGGLALRLAGELLRRKVRIGGVFALSGWLDYTLKASDYAKLSRGEAYLPAKRIEKISTLFLGHPATSADNPVDFIGENFPPLLLICGDTEILRLDSERAYSKAKEHNVSVKFHYFRGGLHAFPVVATLPESRRALKLVSRFISEC